MTIQQIVDEMAQEVGGSVSDSSLESILFLCLKAGFRRVPIQMRSRTFVFQGSVSVPNGDYEISLSTITGFIKERAVWYLDSNSVRVPILPHRSVQDFHNKFAPNLYGKPARYLIYQRTTMQFDRRVDEALTVGLDYFKEVSSISLSDTFAGDEQLVEVAKSYAYERYYRNYEEDKQKADDNRDEGARLMLQLEGEYEDSELGGYVEQLEY